MTKQPLFCATDCQQSGSLGVSPPVNTGLAMQGSSPRYAHPPPRPWLARITMAAIFGLTLFYPLLLAALALTALWAPWATGVAVAVALSSLWWAEGPWRAVSYSSVFDSWRSHVQFRVWRETELACEASEKGTNRESHKENDSSRDRPILFVAVPHGIFPLALPLLSGPVMERVFPELRAPRGAAASVFFSIPLLAPLVTWLGAVEAKRETLADLLQAGTSCLLFPDGIAGAYHGTRETLLLGRSWERLAQDTGARIVPVYCFGHTCLWPWAWPAHPQHWLARLSRRLRMALIWYWPVLPVAPPHGLNVVFGPMLGEGEHYEDALRALYDRHKGMFGYGDAALVIEYK